MVIWKPPPLDEAHRDALPRFLVLMGILAACGVLLALA